MHTLHGVFYSTHGHSQKSGLRSVSPRRYNVGQVHRRSGTSPRPSGLLRVVFAAFALIGFLASARAQISGHVLISEVYGGGGNAGALYKQDFVELYNPTPDPVVMTHWSIQYASSAGIFTSANRTVFSGTIAPRSYFLIQEAQGSGGSVDLPSPDVIGTTAFASSNGKVALVRDTILIAGPADPPVVDFIGYGTANQFEGSGPAASLGNAVSAERKALGTSTDTTMAPGGIDELNGNGWDSDDNAGDFTRCGVQGPQNSHSGSETPPGATSTAAYSFSARWNLVAVPLRMDDCSAPGLFPGCSSAVFAYEGGYHEEDTLQNGTGYWLKFPADTTITMTGIPRTTDTVDVVPGWNLIGALSTAVATSDVVQVPPGLVSAPFYIYADGYQQADTLFPARGYWVKAGAAGSLIFSAPSSFIHRNIIIR